MATSLARCRACKLRDGNKPVTLFVTWRDAAQVRHGFRTQLCVSCYVAKVAPLDVDRDPATALTCPSCGIDTDTDYDAVYVNQFIPKYGRRDLEVPFCNACAAHYRIWAESVGDALEDRGGADVSPSTEVSSIDVLRALGIQVR